MKPSEKAVESRGSIAWMARNHVAANLLMFVILAGGVFGILHIKQEIFPEFDLDLINISVVYPGASPAEVEQAIVLAIEEAVRGLDGVKRTTASASEGVGTVSVELLLDADANKLLADVKSAVDRIRSFPLDAEKPMVTLATRRREVISLIIAGELPLRVLHDIAERARIELLASDEITQIEVEGVPPLEISIEIPQTTLEAYGLSLPEVAAQVSAASIELPSGSIKTKSGELLVRVAERRKNSREFEDIILRSTSDGSEVRLGEIARIQETYEDNDRASFYNGMPAVRLICYRVGDETPAGVARFVREYKKELQGKIPEAVKVSIWDDNSEILTSRTQLLVRNAGYGLILVFTILALFLDLRLAFWVSLGIPISFLGAFFLMPGLDTSINIITLFAFIVTLGLVVDDAIVVGENIFEKIDKGKPRLQAAIEGAREMAMPVTFSVLTTMAAFSPLLFVPGVMGKIFRFIPLVVITVLAFSLIESFYILPAHLTFGRAKRSAGDDLSKKRRGLFSRIQSAFSKGLVAFTQRTYKPFLLIVVRHRYNTVAVAIALFIITGALVFHGIVPFRFFPKMEGDVLSVTARLPYGSPVERTIEIQKVLESSLGKAVEQHGGKRILRGVFTSVGAGKVRHGPASGASQQGGHLVTVYVHLVPVDKRNVTTQELAATWQEMTPPIAGLDALLFDAVFGPSAGADVAVQLSHRDYEVLKRASSELTETLRTYTELKNIENAYTAGKRQYDFQLKPHARTLGFTAADVARQLRGSFYGLEAIREQRERNEVRVMVRLPEAERRSLYDLEKLLIRSPKGGQVPLSYIAEYSRDRAPTVINREEGRRVVEVTAELQQGVASSRGVITSLKQDVLPEFRHKYPELSTSMVGTHRERQESFQALGQNFVLIQFVLFALLAIPFRSYVQPLIVMSAIPFGFVGAVMGHLIMGFNLSFMSLFGIIALSGVVVNDSLVLIDSVNKMRQSGQSALESLINSGMRRMRPILLTSLTTFGGLAPMILESSVQARFLIPMAISLGFGVLFATFITLLLVPALYLIVEDVRSRFTQDVAAKPAPAVSHG